VKICCVLIMVVVATIVASGVASGQDTVHLTLKEAEDLAVRNHPQLSAALLTAQAANEVPTEANSARYPTFFGAATGAGAPDNSRIAAGGLNNPIILSRAATGVGASQLLLDFGRTDNLVKSARLHAKAVGENAVEVRAQVLLQVDRAYYLALRARAVLKVAEETVSARQLVVEQADALQKSGLKSGLDVSIADYNLAESKLLLSRSRNDVKAAYADLSAAIGSSDEFIFDLADEKALVLALPDEAATVKLAMTERPQLSALKFDRDAASRLFAAEKALKWPSVSAVWNAGVAPIHTSVMASTYNAAGVIVNIPIFNGRLYKAREAEADYKARAMEETLRDGENRVARDVRIAWLGADAAAQRIGLAAQLVNRANEALSLAQERYRLGLSSIVELSQAQLNLTVAELETASAKYDYLIQRATLSYQSGELH
jgi:outer membrane protein